MLEENIVADGIDEGSETLGLAQCAGLTQPGKNTGKSLLTHILDSLGRLQPRAEFQMEQLSEIADEVLLGPRVPGTEVFDVSRIECMKLQGCPRRP